MEVVERGSLPAAAAHKELRALEFEAAGYSHHKDMVAARTAAAHIVVAHTAVHSLALHTPVVRTAADHTD